MKRMRAGIWAGSVLAIFATSVTLIGDADGQFVPPMPTIMTMVPLPSLGPVPTITSYPTAIAPLPTAAVPFPTAARGGTPRPSRRSPSAAVAGNWVSDGDEWSFSIERGAVSALGISYSATHLDGSGEDRFPGRRWQLTPATDGSLVGTWSTSSSSWMLRVRLSADQNEMTITCKTPDPNVESVEFSKVFRRRIE